jgi:ADP-ribosylglycohydrolase
MNMLPPKDRFLGALLGLATGDALGTALEFAPQGTFAAIDDMVGGGPFRLKPGQWTDDTSMALCPARRPVAKRSGWRPAWSSVGGSPPDPSLTP